MSVYHVGRNGVEIAQISEAELHKIAGKEFLPTDVVWTAGMPAWQSVETFLNSRRHLYVEAASKSRGEVSSAPSSIGERGAPKSYLAQKVLQTEDVTSERGDFWCWASNWWRGRWCKMAVVVGVLTSASVAVVVFRDELVASISQVPVVKVVAQGINSSMLSVQKKFGVAGEWPNVSKVTLSNECIDMLDLLHENISNVDIKKRVCVCVSARVIASMPAKAYEELRRAIGQPSIRFLDECIAKIGDVSN